MRNTASFVRLTTIAMFLSACGKKALPVQSPYAGEPILVGITLKPDSNVHLGDEVVFTVYAENAERIYISLVRIPSLMSGRIYEEVKMRVDQKWPVGASSVNQPILFMRPTMAFANPVERSSNYEALAQVQSGYYELRVEISGRSASGKRSVTRGKLSFHISQ